MHLVGCSGFANLHRCWRQLELELELLRSHLVGCQGLAKLYGGAWRDIETLKSALIIPHWVSDPEWRISKLLMSVCPSVHPCMCLKLYSKGGWKDVFTECTNSHFLPNHGKKKLWKMGHFPLTDSPFVRNHISEMWLNGFQWYFHKLCNMFPACRPFFTEVKFFLPKYKQKNWKLGHFSLAGPVQWGIHIYLILVSDNFWTQCCIE